MLDGEELWLLNELLICDPSASWEKDEAYSVRSSVVETVVAKRKYSLVLDTPLSRRDEEKVLIPTTDR